LEKFNKKKNFLVNIWVNFIEIASISEETKPIYFNEEDESTEMKNKWLKFLEIDYKIQSKMEFCDEIQRNLIDIKLKTLKYAIKIFGDICSSPYFPKKILSQNMDLFKLFLLNSIDDRVLLKTCECVDLAKSRFIFAFNNICVFNSQIEEILLSKSSQLFKNVAKSTRFSFKLLQESPAVSPFLPMDFSLGIDKSFQEGELKNKTLLQLTSVLNEEDTGKKEDEIEEDNFEKEKRVKKHFCEELDRWLCYDGISF